MSIDVYWLSTLFNFKLYTNAGSSFIIIVYIGMYIGMYVEETCYIAWRP